MYQLEVKRWLVQHKFPPSRGWTVRVDVDAMERARGGSHPPEKAARVALAEQQLCDLGATICAHPDYGRVDIAAEHPRHGLVLIEVEGSSSRQKEQAVYSALGQLLLYCRGADARLVLAVPDEPDWERQLKKVPPYAADLLQLRRMLVSPQRVREL